MSQRSLIKFSSIAACLVISSAALCVWAQDSQVNRPTRSDQYQHHEFPCKDGETLDYWLLTPKKFESGKKYPLVLTLHGRGGNTDAATVLAGEELQKKYPCFVLAPAVERRQTWAVPKDFRKLPGRQRLPYVLELVEQIKSKHPIDPQRVYVTGQSMGGFGTFGAVAHSAETFAAAMPVCGGWEVEDAEKMQGVAFWIFHGDKDGTVPVERSQTMVEALKQAGAAPKYTEYPGVGHNSWSRTYARPEVWEWLFAQRRSK